MTLKDFLNELDNLQVKDQLSEAGLDFFNQLKEKSNNTFTENGKKILRCMQQNSEKYKTFNSKQIGELLFMPPRSVSDSIKKLINEGYCEKLNTNPVTYKITMLGKDIQLD